MSILEVPAAERKPYPSLGGEVCDWQEANLVFGPGDLRGQPYRLDEEKRRLVWRLYEVYPRDHPNAGRRRFRRAAISLRKGSAKALALDTPIPTPTGWTTIGWLAPGDLVFGSDGKPYPVTAVSETWDDKPCYRVIFNDGTSIVASGDHRWATQTRRWPREGLGIFTTEEIRDSLFWHPHKPYANHRIPNAAPLVGEAVELPIEPYLLGLWLGDGTTLQPMLTVGAQDEAEMVAQLDSMGQGHSVYHYPNRAATVYLKRQKVPLRDAGLLGNKHIPPNYLRAPRPDRLALLQGLMDTDGSVSSRACSYSSTSKRLAEGVLELVRTLGLRPYLMTGVARLNGEDLGPHYRVNFTPRDDVPVFRLKRKAQAAKRVARKLSQALCRTIRAVEPIEPVPVRCIAIDSPDHLFLAGPGMVPTHNTELGAALAAVELAPNGPVRCDGWRREGKLWHPVGRPMRDPYIAPKGEIARGVDRRREGAPRRREGARLGRRSWPRPRQALRMLPSYSGIAPIEVSSGEVTRHRLSRNGNRALNNAPHSRPASRRCTLAWGATTHERKLAEHKSSREALRSLSGCRVPSSRPCPLA